MDENFDDVKFEWAFGALAYACRAGIISISEYVKLLRQFGFEG